MNRKGKVYLVGAGPGRADLITVRGAELLKTADCIICDKLANPALLKFARPGAEIIHVPKRIGPGSATQDQINKLMVEKAKLGKTVVRLKGGDPGIFGRTGQELSSLTEAGIDFEIVPGVTAAVAAAESAGILLTDRDYSSQVVFITGREAEGKQKSNIDWNMLAKCNGTIVFYMAMENLKFITGQLIKNGMAEETPTAVIADATLPTQKTVRASLNKISETCKENKIEPPAIVVIGAAADEKLNWLANKPLFGKTTIITRDTESNADFAAKIIAKGGSPIEFPTIKIEPLTHTNNFLQMFTKLAEYDWLIFTSANGVTVLFDALQKLDKDARVFASIKIAAIGSETAAKLAEFGIKADFTPNVFTSKELGKQLLAFTNLKNKKVLLLRSQFASNELCELLENTGAKADNVPIYTTVTVKNDSGLLIEKIEKGKIDWLTFASPSSVKAFFEQIPADLINSSNIKVASIGPVTSEQLKTLGLKVDMQATEHTIDGLLDAIEKMYE
ncbi:MAG: uroporphyrinogen-III C-methyltransferase [Phycisphaerae bacterium]|nr:uroporphyrinogen-III C-methyltransferase [Phycisphaerae bacterium]MDD5381201.1 uroporphyrinogen-III C-methyltransferase [Phycisphaerae bacterium]